MFKQVSELSLAFCNSPYFANFSWFHVKRPYCYCWDRKSCYSKSVRYKESKVFFFMPDKV
jgi:hypothetical protein